MKRLLLIFCTLLLSACVTTGPTNTSNWRQDAYDQEAEKIGAKVRSGTLRRSEANQEMVSVAKSYFPNDPLLIGIWEDLAALALRLEAGEMTEAEYKERLEMRWDRFNAANRGRHAEAEALAEQQRRQNATGSFLQNMSNSINRNFPKPIQCNSSQIGGQVSTTCY